MTTAKNRWGYLF